MEKIYQLVQDQSNKMIKTGKLFKSSISGSEIWNLYLSGFAKKEIFRDPESSVHNCNTCHLFFKKYSNIVAISGDLRIISLFDCYELVPEDYKNSFMIISKKLKKAVIKDTFIETLDNLKIEAKKQCEIDKENAVDGDPDLEFLGEGKVDSKEVLKFEILKDIYVTKKTEKENSILEAEKRIKNKRIMEIIAKKQDENLQGKSIEELQAMLEN